ncbi:MAG: response regulator transcription factor [Pseudomonadota bacterium]
MAHVLVVDDDAHIVDVIGFALQKSGHTFTVARNGQDALDQYTPNRDDLIVLDVGMPEIDGLEVCRQIRKSSETPILFLSARDEEIDRILGLEIGGDDYVTKPFSPRELMARISVILKRTQNSTQRHVDSENTLQAGQLRVEPTHRSAYYSDREMKLTAIEFNILQTVLGRPRMVFTREQLLNAAWPPNIHVSDRTIDSHVRNLRAKLSKAGCVDAIETVHGIGFRLGSCE